MNLENLELNIKYKNYREVCAVLIDKIKSGNAKIAQLKEWKRYFIYHKDGNAFVIDEIYDTKKPKVENRGKSEGSRNNYKGIYGKYLVPILEDFFSKQHKNPTYISNNCLAEFAKMVNFNYRTCAANREKVHRYLGMANYVAENDVFSIISSKIRPSIISALENLQKQGKITYFKTRIVDGREVTPGENIVPRRVKKLLSGYRIDIINVNDQENIEELERNLQDLLKQEIKKSIKHKVEKALAKKSKNKYEKQRLEEGYIGITNAIINILVSGEYQINV